MVSKGGVQCRRRNLIYLDGCDIRGLYNINMLTGNCSENRSELGRKNGASKFHYIMIFCVR